MTVRQFAARTRRASRKSPRYLALRAVSWIWGFSFMADAPACRSAEFPTQFLSLTSHARLILTDSGALQEESTAAILAGYRAAFSQSAPRTPELWDGRTSERIAAVLQKFLF